MALGQAKANGVGKVYPRKDRIDENLESADIAPCVRNGHKYITEPQLYDLMLEVKTDKVKPFRKWITSELLPAIRKTGKYEVEPVMEKPKSSDQHAIPEERLKVLELLATMPEYAMETATEILRPYMSGDHPEVDGKTEPEPKVIEFEPPMYRLPDECLKAPEPVPTPKKKAASPAGRTIPFNAKKLLNHLAKNGISHGDLARMSGTSRSVLSNSLTGKSIPGFESRAKWCVALKKPVDWLNG